MGAREGEGRYLYLIYCVEEGKEGRKEAGKKLFERWSRMLGCGEGKWKWGPHLAAGDCVG
jgi:hypothetical protein